MRITKSQLQKIIKEEVKRIAEWGDGGTDYRSPASMLSQANDNLGEALNKMEGMRGTGEWTAQSERSNEAIDKHYDTLVGIYKQINTIKDALVQAGRE